MSACSDPGHSLLVEERFSYQIINEIGEGKFGKVYKAMEKTSKELFAIKVLPISKRTIKDVEREIEMLRDCDTCSNVVRFCGTYQTKKHVYIVMEFCDSGSVARVMKATNKVLEEPQIAAIAYHSLLGLNYLHNNKKIHRDVKGDNILLSSEGIAKLADFGVAAQLKHTLDWHKTANGTPYWMAPELAMQEGYRYSVDIWSLGITVIEMAERRPPFWEHEPMRALFKIMQLKEPPHLSKPQKYSAELNDFIAKCLVLDPSQRWTSAQLLEHPFILRYKGQARAIVTDLLEQYALTQQGKPGVQPSVPLNDGSKAALNKMRSNTIGSKSPSSNTGTTADLNGNNVNNDNNNNNNSPVLSSTEASKSSSEEEEDEAGKRNSYICFIKNGDGGVSVRQALPGQEPEPITPRPRSRTHVRSTSSRSDHRDGSRRSLASPRGVPGWLKKSPSAASNSNINTNTNTTNSNSNSNNIGNLNSNTASLVAAMQKLSIVHNYSHHNTTTTHTNNDSKSNSSSSEGGPASNNSSQPPTPLTSSRELTQDLSDNTGAHHRFHKFGEDSDDENDYDDDEDEAIIRKRGTIVLTRSPMLLRRPTVVVLPAAAQDPTEGGMPAENNTSTCVPDNTPTTTTTNS
eukprot:TRINITY_DN4208_c2_g2_i2.p1 TRINITY_DN4208_c2_g2~~TRINITY_DN4208_c2_g2_i2.p1  ORF type:complete len:629 (+),score=143.34 TRINITY_DN4208_c2_g2_i2:106-1992(+)